MRLPCLVRKSALKSALKSDKLTPHREVAQFGGAQRSGRWGRRFKSCLPDHNEGNNIRELAFGYSLFLCLWFVSDFMDSSGAFKFAQARLLFFLTLVAPIY
jgi:hypothetical protein